ncbi:MAG: hypothetical protein B7Y86_12945 [Brevundimonas subvibrioides]|uniref:IPTL-CTERM protein sorting domain-containing protein n=1 Tax=Brevundimonas subvibrioides TaxID=74313 RepID=A0A258HEZ3_9CAUL|nr:MAG: hypothetical protein B7Y86_12945 [Brevundimonas subvibrioides]
MTSVSSLRAFGLVLIACFGIALAAPATAQTISVPANGGSFGASTFVGQSFTATVTGTVTQIRVVAEANNATTVRFYNGTGTGVFNAAGSPLYSQAVNLTDATPGFAFQTITLGTPLPVTSGNVYSFSFDAASLRGAASTYAGGIGFISGTGLQAGIDTTFEVVQVAAPVPVPTLSEWALILFGLILAGGAALYIQRRQMAV